MKWNLRLESKKWGIGSLNSQGGVLLSVLLTVFLFSFLLLNLLTTYQQTVDFTYRTNRLYQAKIIKELFLIDYPNLTENNGKCYFNVGELTYQKQNKNLMIEIKIKQKTFKFQEPLEEISKK